MLYSHSNSFIFHFVYGKNRAQLRTLTNIFCTFKCSHHVHMGELPILLSSVCWRSNLDKKNAHLKMSTEKRTNKLLCFVVVAADYYECELAFDAVACIQNIWTVSVCASWASFVAIKIRTETMCMNMCRCAVARLASNIDERNFVLLWMRATMPKGWEATLCECSVQVKRTFVPNVCATHRTKQSNANASFTGKRATLTSSYARVSKYSYCILREESERKALFRFHFHALVAFFFFFLLRIVSFCDSETELPLDLP